MKTILFAQEFGGGYGHLTHLTGIASQLRRHNLVFALPRQSMARQLIEARVAPGLDIREAPPWQNPANLQERRQPDVTLADAFHRIGYHELARLAPVAQAWSALIDDLRPDLIVGDFVPTLRLICPPSIPMLVVGGWYMTPPPGRELPAIRFWENYLPPASRRRESEALAAANAVRRQNGRPVLAFFADLFQGERSFATGFAGFDPYARYRSDKLLQPYNIGDITPGPPVAERRGPAVFCYLGQEMPGLNAVLTALNGLASPSQVFVRGVDPHEVASNCAPQVSVHPKPADLAVVLPQAQLFLHYGAAGATYSGLLAGVPQFMCSDSLEHQANAWCIQQAGCGLGATVARDADPSRLRGIIETLLADSALQAQTLAYARRLARDRDPDPRRAIVAAAQAFLGEAGAGK